MKNKNPYKFPIVEVIWDDAETDMGWDLIPQELSPAVATTVGFLAKETQDHLLICSTYDKHHTNARLQIPKKMVISLRELRISHPRKLKNKEIVDGSKEIQN
jgi:hypothetical protein